MESGSEFLQRKAEERERFQTQERSSLEVRALKTFVLVAKNWKLGKRAEAERATALRRLKDLGIDVEALS